MELQHGLNNQQQSLFRSHPQMNAGYLGWHSYSADISRNQVPVPMICGNTKIDVIVNYGNNQNHSTNGGTKKYENN